MSFILLYSIYNIEKRRTNWNRSHGWNRKLSQGWWTLTGWAFKVQLHAEHHHGFIICVCERETTPLECYKKSSIFPFCKETFGTLCTSSDARWLTFWASDSWQDCERFWNMLSSHLGMFVNVHTRFYGDVLGADDLTVSLEGLKLEELGCRQELRNRQREKTFMSIVKYFRIQAHGKR